LRPSCLIRPQGWFKFGGVEFFKIHITKKIGDEVTKHSTAAVLRLDLDYTATIPLDYDYTTTVRLYYEG